MSTSQSNIQNDRNFEAAFNQEVETMSYSDLISLLKKHDNRAEKLKVVCAAARIGRTDIVKAIQESLPNSSWFQLLASQESRGFTPLHWAAHNDHATVVEGLLQLIPNSFLFQLLKIPDNNGFTAVHWAAHKGNYESIKCLICNVPANEVGKLLSMQDNNRFTAMHWAVSRCHAEMAKHLLNAVPKEERYKLLLIPDKSGITPVYWATHKGNLGIIKSIVEALSPPDICKLLTVQDKNKFTTLHWAVHDGYTDLFRCLVRALSSSTLFELLTIQDINGFTTIHWAAHENRSEIMDSITNMLSPHDLYKLLVLIDKDRFTPVHWAAHKGSSQVMKCIIDILPAANWLKLLKMPEKNGVTAIYWAVINNHVATCKIIADSVTEADFKNLISGRDSNHFTSVHWVARKGLAQIMKCITDKLLDNDLFALLCMQNKNGSTPVKLASSGGHVDTLRLMLEILSPDQRSEVLGIQDKNHSTALDVANENNRSDVINFFREYQVVPNRIKPNFVPRKHTQDVTDSLQYMDEYNRDIDVLKLDVKPCTSPSVTKLYHSHEAYKMSAPLRGRCLIINNQNFQRPTTGDQIDLSYREGSDVDVTNVRNVFHQLNFKCDVHTDLTCKEMRQRIWDETRNPDYKNLGVSALVIMTHGSENHIFGKDGRSISLSDVYDLMSPYSFQSMAGKPKIIIIQACAGGRADTLGHFADDSPGSRFVEHDQPFPGNYLQTDDLFLLKSSFLSFRSMRHSLQGSWFIRALVCSLYNHACEKDIQSIFQQVKDIVRQKSIDMSKRDLNIGGQQPTYECFPTHGRKFYLFPKFDPPSE